MSIRRKEYYKPEFILRQVKLKLDELNRDNRQVDYITFVPDGESTLDKNLGIEIKQLKQFGIKIAVIMNSSLLWMEDVRNDLMCADWVSVKIDAVDNATWKKIDRPHGSLVLSKILNGTIDFSREFKGTLVTETMLVKGINDSKGCLRRIAGHVNLLNPSTAYILVPTRPPAESFVQKPSMESIRNAYDIIHTCTGVNTEIIAGDEGDNFYFTDNLTDDLLSIASVHPIKEDVIEKILSERQLDKSVIDKLVDMEMLKAYVYENKRYYKRNI